MDDAHTHVAREFPNVVHRIVIIKVQGIVVPHFEGIRHTYVLERLTRILRDLIMLF
jgi:hypothetical protein